MKKKLLLINVQFLCYFTLIFSQNNQGKICDIDGTCVFELKPKTEYHTKSGVVVEKQFKEATTKNTACDVTVWTDGDRNSKVYKHLESHKKPVELIKKSTGKRIIRFQYVGDENDAAVEASNDVIFVDHDFTVYLVMR